MISFKRPHIRLNWRVFITASVIVGAIALWAILTPTGAASALGAAVTAVAEYMGWFYILTSALVMLFMFWVALSRNGTRRLGADTEKPQFGAYAWASMLFAAGIGVDLLFFSVAEPVAQYYAPPRGSGQSVQAARDAVVMTLFHYGITGWAIYALMGLAFGYFAYRFQLPLTIRSALYPLIGRRIHGAIGDGIEVAALLGTIFGVATSLGIGVVQLNFGLHLLLGVPQNLGAQLALVTLAVAVATVSAVSGVDKGIKRLSELNVALAIFLVFYVFITGKTKFLLNALVMNIGDYLSTLPGMALDTYAYSNADTWLNSWTLFFWAWWIAWAPFVGLFLARISRGRTLRQYTVGTMVVPFTFVLGWVAVFGNSALEKLRGGDERFGQLALAHPEQAFYELLLNYPGATFVAALASVIGLLLYVTSADSSALVMANFSSRITDAAVDGHPAARIYWAALTGLLTVAMLLVGGIPALQSATIVMGLPFSFVLYLLMFALWRTFRGEPPEPAATPAQLSAALEALAADRPAAADPLADLGLTWAQSIQRATTYPSAQDCATFISDTVVPALRQVLDSLPASHEGGEVKIFVRGGFLGGSAVIPSAALVLPVEADCSFRYEVVPVEVPLPSYALRAEPTRDAYFRAEVQTAGGYDLMWLDGEQIRKDASRRFEQFLEELQRPASSEPR